MAQHAAGKPASAGNRNPFFIQCPMVALSAGAHRISAITARPGAKLAMIDLIRL